MKTITEQSTKIKAELPKKDVNAKMPVFYNPVMKSNRNISILLINSIPNKNMNIALPLAGSGIRGLRFLNELKKNKIKMLFVNDKKENFVKMFLNNLKLNNLNKIKVNNIKTNNDKIKKISVFNEDGNLFLLNQPGFDYIDIDPFGSPNPFLAAATARISRNGILAVTATDTAALTGTYQKVTKRKYWASSLKNYMMHELGLRILIRKVQLQGIQFDKSLIPILSYHKEHYFRIYFRSERGKERCDQIIKEHKYFLYNPKTLEFKTSVYNKEEGFEFIGPLWTGKLFDKELVKKMAKNNPFPEEQKFLNLLQKESNVDVVGFYDLHTSAKKSKKDPPKMDVALKKLKGTRTHFSLTGIKTKNSVTKSL